jgi:hypothetical protein
MTRPPSKLWKNGFSESISLPKGMLLSGENPLHDYVLTLGSMGDDTPPAGCQELFCSFNALLLGYGVII